MPSLYHCSIRILGASAAFLLFASLPTLAAPSADEDDYQKRVEKAELTENPQNHKQLADWCRRRYPAKYQYHLDAWNEYEFGRMEKLLPARPTVTDYLRLSEAAGKMGLAAKEKEYRGKWGAAQFAVHAAKLKNGTPIMRKQLLAWAVKEKVEHLPECHALAKAIVAEDPDHGPARRILRHLKMEGGWATWEEALASISDLQVASDRLPLHRALAERRAAEPPPVYPANPVAGLEEANGIYTAATKNSKGEALYRIWFRDYDPEKPCPLVISLHGGGEGGVEKSRQYSLYDPGEWRDSVKEGSWIVMSPTARRHVLNSWWNKDNLEDVFDMLEETFARFNVDRKRIYVTGQLMGGNGTGEWMWAFPEFAAASCARSGAYWTNWNNLKDVLGKPVLVIHGEKDDKLRIDSRNEFIRKTEDMGGRVKHISYPDKDHVLRPPDIFPHMIPFFESYVNPIEPDLDLLREVFRDRHRKYPQPE